MLPESDRSTPPVVLAVTLGVAIFKGTAGLELGLPISPLPVLKVSAVVPVTVPDPFILPDPVAVTVSVVPLTLPFIAIELLVPVSVNPSVPLAVTVLFNDMPPLLLSLILTLPPVDAPLPVIAVNRQ